MKKNSEDKSVVRRESLYRLLFLNKELSDRRFPVSTKQLAEDLLAEGIKEGSQKLESVKRLIIQDLYFLIEKLDAPIEYDKQMKGWRYTKRDFIISRTAFIDRLLKIDHEIRAGECPNPKTLAKCLGVSERTIKKDIRFLNSISKGDQRIEKDLIKFNKKRGRYYYTVSDFRVPHIEKMTHYDREKLRALVSRELIHSEDN